MDTEPTIEDIDQALTYATQNNSPWKTTWAEWIDELLDQRLDVSQGKP
jgi:hypothetical protein